ncbi:MAG: tetratricopeptide repeat protein [Ignavibacteria bacterium]|nr:tetratricopeptide repeat protein [Ignavibacteria bacterium]
MKIARIFLQSLIFSAYITAISVSAYSQENNGRPVYTDKDKAIDLFIEGKTLELKHDYVGAVQCYQAALKFDRSHGIYHALSDVYFRLAKYDEARIEIQNALKLDPDNIDYLENLANSYIAVKDFNKAAATYEKILKIDKDYTYGLYSLARLYEELRMPAQALEVYERITDKIGFDFDVLNKMYDIYVSNKNYVKAAEVLENVLKIDPYNMVFKRLLGSLYMQTGKYDDARRVYENVFMLNPADKAVQTELVRLYFIQNESYKAFDNFSQMLGKDSLGYQEKLEVGQLYLNMVSQDSSAAGIAKGIFEKLNEQYQSEWLPYYYLGTISIIENDKPKSEEMLRTAVEKADTSREAYVTVGLTHYQNGDADAALKVINLGLARFPEDYRLHYIKGLSLQSQDDLTGATIHYEKAVDLYPDDVNILSALALAYDTQGLFSKSEEAYERALKIDPTNALILNNYAYNLSERDKNLDKALSMAKIAIEKEPENASYLDTIGWIYFKMRNYKSAKEFIAKSLQVNPNSSVVLEHLGDIYGAMKDNLNALKYWKLALEKNPGNMQLKQKIEFNSIS